MPKPRRPWIVSRHDPIEKLDDNLWAVQGDVPGVGISRRMCIIKMDNGGLVFFNAVPIEPAALEEVCAWGNPSMLIVPSHLHLIDAHAFAEKLEVPVYGPAAGEDKIRQRVDLAGTLETLPSDPSFRVETVAGLTLGEPAVIVKSGDRQSILFGDALQNHNRDTLAFSLRLFGYAGGPKVTLLLRLLFLRDKNALKAQLERWASLPCLTRLVPAHGEVVSTGAANALLRARAAV